jgi:hypothetical protein
MAKADVYLELTRDRKKARKWALISRPGSLGRVPREVTKQGHPKVAVKNGLV